jgi:hypothetical protein
MFKRGVEIFWRALKANWIPAVGIWVAGALVVYGYYDGGFVFDASEWILSMRGRLGIVYPMLSMMLFGALLPTLTVILAHPKDRRIALHRLMYLVPFWTYKGAEVDLFYRLQAWVFGTSNDFVTVACKVAVDQFVYTPTVCMVSIVLFLRWVARRTGEIPAGSTIMPKSWYGQLALPVIVANWALWIPAVSLVYMLPTALQLPLANLILWLWSMMLIWMAKDQG